MTCQLAMRLAEDFGATAGQTTVLTAMRSEKTIRARFYRLTACRWRDDYQFPQYPFDPFA